ncbi:hypothetical protein [Candidatus Albibeggiatoa sp. nov. NOAA]|uniref:hypothetical protein n=1 Tax=Candidatus Albibeggiatoa sp. nov. NOAA TaxID=3162724 RepID=UPI0032F49B51|nr:hypothetical protein [Thiotrichaceae bacterium]
MNTTVANMEDHSPLLAQFTHFANALPDALLLITAKGRIVAINQKTPVILKIETLVDKILMDVVDNPATQIGFYLKMWSHSRTPTPANLLWLSDELDENGSQVIVKKKLV